MSWSFQRIPPEQHGRILEAYSQGDYITITAIYKRSANCHTYDWIAKQIEV